MQEKKFEFTINVLLIPFLFLLGIWSVYYLNWRYFLELNEFGIYPRDLSGLKGVLFSPFLHGSIGHIANNSVAIIVLLSILYFFYKEDFWKVLLFGWLFSGLGTWLIGRESFHIGASGIVYVLTSFIFFAGMRTKYYRLMALSFFVVLIYGGSIWYLFPDVEEGISWEGHLAGFLTGITLAFTLEKRQYEPMYKYEWQHPDFDPSEDVFMKHFDEKGNFNPKPKNYIELNKPKRSISYLHYSMIYSGKITYDFDSYSCSFESQIESPFQEYHP
nr:rhomboid family intramembrane serine protease [uncultured Flavobacterium sp.]